MKIRDTLLSILLFIKQATIIKEKFFTSLCLIVFLIPSLASANNYYVSPSGSNAYTGNLSSPFKTINYGISKLKAGDILYVRTGIYFEKVDISISGTASNPIVIMAYPGELPIIDGTGTYVDVNTALVVFWGSYVHFIGFEIRNSSSNGIVSEGTNNLISHCTIHSVSGSAIGLGGNYDIAEYCTVYNCAMSNENGTMLISWPAGISARRSPDYCIIRHCIVHDVWGEGISTFESTHTTIEDNTVYDCWSVGIYISDATDCIAQRNLVYLTKTLTNGPMVGLGYWNEKNSPSNARNTIINNIVYGCYRNLYVGSPLIETLIANNTFVNSIFESCVEITGGDHTSAEFKNNIIIQEDALPCMNATFNANVVYSHNLYNKSYDTDAVGAGDVIGDPKLTKTGEIVAGNLTADYFKLLSTSAAIDKGTVVSVVIQDFFGNPRDATPDIGAYEYIVPVTGITVTGAAGSNTITTDKGTLQLISSVLPANAANRTVVWSLVNGTGQASISSSGLVTAIGNGTVTARATATDGSGVYGTLLITISNQAIPVTGIVLSGAGGTVTITSYNGTLQLSAAVSPSNATNKTVTWSLTNGTGQATINSSGLVSAIGNGTVTARASATDGSGVYGMLLITISNQVIAASPVFVSSAVENATPSVLEMTYNLSLANSVPVASAFTVLINSIARTVNNVVVSGNKVKLTLAIAVVYGDFATIAYAIPSTNPLQTASGGIAASIGNQPVINNCINIAPAVNQPPVITISNPQKGNMYENSSGIDIDAIAYDPDGTISKVELYSGSNKLVELTSAPYFYTWKNVNPGTYTITAIATDNLNATTISSPVDFKVRGVSSYDGNSEIVNLYPNPNDGHFSIAFINPLQNIKYEIIITDLAGRQVYHGPLTKEETLKQFDLSYIKSGIYIMTIIDKVIFVTKKFVKK